MQQFITLKPIERKRVIQKSANDLGLRFDIIEKDIWVCYVLQKLFLKTDLKNNLVFKGGTCLSKAYDAISRFSEDVDITINSEVLEIAGNSQKADKIKSRTKKAARKFVEDQILPFLDEIFDRDLGRGNYELAFDELDKNNVTLLFIFPSDLPFNIENSYSYIRPKIKLEFGALGGIWPVTKKIIKPYAKEILPDYFSEFEVNTLDIKRNFIEKLLILHSVVFRPSDKPINQNYSRHYYDVYSVIKGGIKVDLIDDLKVLKSVVKNKNDFWSESWIKYDEINKFSDISLTPSKSRMVELKKDYKNMEEMFFRDFPKFEEMMFCLSMFCEEKLKNR